MKLTRTTLALGLLAALAAPAAHAEVEIDVIGGSEVSFEGLLQADFNWFDSDVTNLNGDLPDGDDFDNELRRAELVLKGKGPGNFDWVLGYDAKADRFLDANIKYRIGGNGNHFVQVGQFKQPNSMEELASTRHNDFISKAMATNTFGIARRTGVAYRYGDTNWGVTGTYFGRTLTRGASIVAATGTAGTASFRPAIGSEGHGRGYGIRGNWAPINETGNILHLGLSYITQDTDADVTRIRTRPQADLAGARLVDTGVLRNTEDQTIIGAEAMWVRNQFKVQGEYMQSKVGRYATTPLSAAPAGDFDANSWYVSGVWNITGETWGYRDGVNTTSLPSDPAKGMWQVGLRYDSIDLDDGRLRPGATPTAAPIVDGVLGGEMDSWTVGVNWYWRSNFKFMANYVMVDASRYNSTLRRVVDESPNIAEARLQFYW
jgi:phosphate-selective porin OprO and OprP